MSRQFSFDSVEFGNRFSAYVLQSNFLEGAEEDYEKVSIDGRNGDLIFFNNRYKNKDLWVALCVYDNVDANIDAMRNYLLSKHDYCRYEDSIRPNEYRMAKYTGEFAPKKYFPDKATIVLEFDGKPQRWLKTGDKAIAVTGSSIVLNNPTLHEAKPLIRIFGHGSFTVNNLTVTVEEHQQEYIDMDSELFECHCGAYQMGTYVSSPNHNYPTLGAGNNTITTDGVTLQVTPRWYTL